MGVFNGDDGFPPRVIRFSTVYFPTRVPPPSSCVAQKSSRYMDLIQANVPVTLSPFPSPHFCCSSFTVTRREFSYDDLSFRVTSSCFPSSVYSQLKVDPGERHYTHSGFFNLRPLLRCFFLLRHECFPLRRSALLPNPLHNALNPHGPAESRGPASHFNFWFYHLLA